MNRDETFSIWAPDDSPWSRWAKPVLFAYLDWAKTESSGLESVDDLGWCPPSIQKVALVLDLPGASGVLTGLALARLGYRPVPLYNAVPLPLGEAPTDSLTGSSVVAVDVVPIIQALAEGANILSGLNLPSEAPPAFLLDAHRRAAGRKMEPDEFDNRSVSFTTDFPSANFLSSRGIERVVLVQKDRDDPQPDLAHSLRRWQQGGLVLERKNVNSSEPTERFEVPRPSFYGTMFQRVLISLGLRRAGDGGFGGWVPESSSGG